MRKNYLVTATAAAIVVVPFAATSALAVPTGAHWTAVNNCTNPITGELTGLHGLWKTFDLYVTLEEGDVVGAVDFGIAGPNTGISTDGTFYQTDMFGSDNIEQNIEFSEFIPELAFDTAVTVNGGDIQFAQAMDWNEAGVTGAWFVNPAQAPGGGPINPNDMWVARVTISADATFLGGELFVAWSGPNGDFGSTINPALGVVAVPNGAFGEHGEECVPTPGAPSIIAIAGLMALRRRR